MSLHKYTATFVKSRHSDARYECYNEHGQLVCITKSVDELPEGAVIVYDNGDCTTSTYDAHCKPDYLHLGKRRGMSKAEKDMFADCF